MNTKVKQMMYCALLAGITAILAQVRITMPGLVPITLQTLAIYLIGAILKPKYAVFATLVYIFMGAIGLPVFAGFSAGIGILVGPTGGYLYSFPIMALVISVVLQKQKTNSVYIVAMLLGTAVCYSIGTAWFVYVTGNTLWAALTWCVFPFLIGDAVKIMVATIIAKKVHIS